MRFIRRIQYLLPAVLFLVSFFSQGIAFSKDDERTASIPGVAQDTLFLADPTIFYHDQVYYLYGTGGVDGFLVYTSSDMNTWTGPVGIKDGYALVKGDAFGSSGFWAPQVFFRNNKFYMAYTADENIALAESESPLGPFKQQMIKPISGEGKQIDPYVFFDEDGKVYLYHVRLKEGNRLFVAEMKSDLSDIKPETLKEVLAATEPWENTAMSAWPVAEGPTVLKRDDMYYLFYSTNDFRNVNYAVGYATASSPTGPWKKKEGNPIINRQLIGQNGPGHGDFLQVEDGSWWYILHTHKSDTEVSPRPTGVLKVNFIEGTSGIDQVVVDSDSFHYLFAKSPE